MNSRFGSYDILSGQSGLCGHFEGRYMSIESMMSTLVACPIFLLDMNSLPHSFR